MDIVQGNEVSTGSVASYEKHQVDSEHGYLDPEEEEGCCHYCAQVCQGDVRLGAGQEADQGRRAHRQSDPALVTQAHNILLSSADEDTEPHEGDKAKADDDLQRHLDIGTETGGDDGGGGEGEEGGGDADQAGGGEELSGRTAGGQPAQRDRGQAPDREGVQGQDTVDCSVPVADTGIHLHTMLFCSAAGGYWLPLQAPAQLQVQGLPCCRRPTGSLFFSLLRRPERRIRAHLSAAGQDRDGVPGAQEEE